MHVSMLADIYHGCTCACVSYVLPWPDKDSPPMISPDAFSYDPEPHSYRFNVQDTRTYMMYPS